MLMHLQIMYYVIITIVDFLRILTKSRKAQENQFKEPDGDRKRMK